MFVLSYYVIVVAFVVLMLGIVCKQFDIDTGNWYENRPLELEADRALEYVYRNM